jgi:hypothetical protein
VPVQSAQAVAATLREPVPPCIQDVPEMSARISEGEGRAPLTKVPSFDRSDAVQLFEVDEAVVSKAHEDLNDDDMGLSHEAAEVWGRVYEDKDDCAFNICSEVRPALLFPVSTS